MTDQKITYAVVEESAHQMGSVGTDMEKALGTLQSALAGYLKGNPAPWGTDVLFEVGDAYHDLARAGLEALNTYVKQFDEAKSRLLQTVELLKGSQSDAAHGLEGAGHGRRAGN
jgi:hypothetical protein